jgi:hypothetical protein
MLAIVITVADAALKLVLPALVAWIGSKSAQWLGAKAGGQQYADALTRVMDLAKIVVAEMQQTMVQELTSAAVDGKVTPEEWAKVKDIAVNKMRTYLGGDAGMVDVAAKLKMDPNNFVAFIGSIIESMVLAAKVMDKNNLPPFLQGPGVQQPPVPLPVALYSPAPEKPAS